MEAEHHMIPTDQWETFPGVPPEAIRIAKEGQLQRIPSGIACHPKHGWMVLQTGQGPYVAWSENDLPE